MRTVIPAAKFRRDLKKAQSSASQQVLLILHDVIDTLSKDIPLAAQFRDHDLTGQWKDFRECHIRPDLLLVYQKAPGVLRLARLASHSDLF